MLAILCSQSFFSFANLLISESKKTKPRRKEAETTLGIVSFRARRSLGFYCRPLYRDRVPCQYLSDQLWFSSQWSTPVLFPHSIPSHPNDERQRRRIAIRIGKGQQKDGKRTETNRNTNSNPNSKEEGRGRKKKQEEKGRNGTMKKQRKKRAIKRKKRKKKKRKKRKEEKKKRREKKKRKKEKKTKEKNRVVLAPIVFASIYFVRCSLFFFSSLLPPTRSLHQAKTAENQPFR